MNFPGYNNNISPLDFVRHKATNGDVIDKVIIVNALVYLVDVAVWLPFRLLFGADAASGRVPYYDAARDWLLVTDNLGELLLKPWSFVSYMFLHHDVFHVFFNMLVLYIFGKILLEFFGNRKVLPIFVLGGIAGALAYVVLSNLFPFFGGGGNSVLLGASGGVSAVMVAAAVVSPNHRIFLLFFGAVKIVHIAAFLVAVDVFMLPFGVNTGGRLAHLGGALFGYVFIKQLQVGNDWSKGFNKVADRAFTFFKGAKLPASGRRADRHQSRAGEQPSSVSHNGGQDAGAMQAGKQEKVDAILDKIAENGYESLSREEKEFLFNYSKE